MINWLIRYIIDDASRQAAVESARRAAREAGDANKQESQEAARSWWQKLRGGFQQAEREGTSAAQRTGNAWKGMVGQVAGMLSAMFGAYQLVAFTREVLGLGVAVGEVNSKFATTLGEAEGRVQSFVDRWGAVAGLNQNEAKDFLATSAAMALGMGYTADAAADLAIEVAKAAGDLTSFNNVPIEQTSRAVRSALVGEREALKTLGIVVMETDVQQRALLNTGKAQEKQLTQQEKAAATLQLIMERMGPAAGDLERTQDSLANTLRRGKAEWQDLKIALGEALVSAGTGPSVLGQLIDWLGRATDYIRDNREEIQVWADNLVKFTVGLLKIGTNVFRFFFNIGQLVGDTLRTMVNSWRATAKQMYNIVITPLNAIIDKINVVREFFGNPLIPRIEAADAQGALDDFTSSMESVSQQAADLRASLMGIWNAFDSTSAAGRRAARVTGISVGTGGAGTTTGAAGGAGGGAAGAAMRRTTGAADPRLAAIGPIQVRPGLGQPGVDAFAAELANQAHIRELQRRYEAEQEYYDRIGELADSTAYNVADAFEEAWERIGDGAEGVGGLAAAAFKGIGQAAMGELATLARGEAKKHFAAALGAAAEALGFTSHGNFASASAAWASAAQHTAAGVAWSALAGGIGAARSGGGGGGRGSGGSAGRSMDSRTADERARNAKNVIIVQVGVDPFDPRKGETSRNVKMAYDYATEKYGKDAVILP